MNAEEALKVIFNQSGNSHDSSVSSFVLSDLYHSSDCDAINSSFDLFADTDLDEET